MDRLDGGHAGTGLGVRAVRGQLVVLPEGLALVVRAHAAGQIGPGDDRPGELVSNRGEEFIVTRLSGLS